MAPRSKKPLGSKPKPKSDVKSMLRGLAAQVAEALEYSRKFGVVVEDMRAQNRATIEAVLNLKAEFQRDRAENRERFDRLDNAVLKLSSDVVMLKSDVAVLKSDVQSLKTALVRVECKIDGKADVVALRSVDARVCALESSAQSA